MAGSTELKVYSLQISEASGQPRRLWTASESWR